MSATLVAAAVIFRPSACGCTLLTFRFSGNAGTGVAENMMSGRVHVRGDASQSAGATGCGGLLVIDGNASARCGISLRGLDIVGKGSVAAKPNRLEIDLEVSAASELTADAIVKYRDTKAAPRSVHLDPGYVPIVSIGTVDARGTVHVRWQRPGDKEPSEVPPEVLFHYPPKP